MQDSLSFQPKRQAQMYYSKRAEIKKDILSNETVNETEKNLESV